MAPLPSSSSSSSSPPPSVDDGTARLPLILLVDAALVKLPWESMPLLRAVPTSRLPCAAFLDGCSAAAARMGGGGAVVGGDGAGPGGVRSSEAFYVLNPAGDLKKTQGAFEADFTSVATWEGVVGTAPTPEAVERALSSKDLYIYCGHSHGGQYLPYERVMGLPRCSAALLGGCSSGALTPHGALAPSGHALAYMHARCPGLVANLWDVTDGEIDKVWKALIDHCCAGGSLLDGLLKARAACKLPHLTGAAVIAYAYPSPSCRSHVKNQERVVKGRAAGRRRKGKA